MKECHFCLLAAAFFTLGAIQAAAQQPGTAGPPVNMVVTVEAMHGTSPGPVAQQDVMVYQGKVRNTVTSWVPAKDDHAELELFILLDDSAGASLACNWRIFDSSSIHNLRPQRLVLLTCRMERHRLRRI
jgi:hypothetical protein